MYYGLTTNIKRRTGSERERRSLEGRVNVAEIRNTCLMLNTAEYCQVTSSEVSFGCQGIQSVTAPDHESYSSRIKYEKRSAKNSRRK